MSHDHPVLPRSVLIRRVRVAGWRCLRGALRESPRESVTGRRLAGVLGIAGQLSLGPVSLVLAAREVQFVRMGNERRTQKARAGGRARLGRDFWFYFSGQAVSQLGGSFTTFALPLLVFKLTHSATNLALTTVAEFVPYLLFGLLLGAVVDRFDRKRLMLGSDIAQALVIAVIPVLAIGGVLRVADIYAVTFVQSTLGIIFDCGEFAAIPSLVGEQELVTANARIMAANNAGQILGPALAGALVAFVPVAGLLFVDAGSFLVSSGCLALIRCSFNAATPARRPAGSAIRALLADVREGLAYVWSNPVLRSISIMMALINFVATTAGSQLVLFARRALHAPSSEIGFLYAAGAAGIVVVSLVAGPIRQRVSFAVTALGALVLAGLTMTAMALAGSYPAALVLWAASSGFGLLFNVNTGALRQAIVPPRLYGRVVSVAQVLAWSAIPLGSLAGAAAINLSGSVAGVYAVIGGLIAAIALVFAFSPVAHGDRYLAEAAGRRAGSAGAGHSPGSGATGRDGAGHGPGFPAPGLPGDPPALAEARTGANRSANTSVAPRHPGPPAGRAPIGRCSA